MNYLNLYNYYMSNISMDKEIFLNYLNNELKINQKQKEIQDTVSFIKELHKYSQDLLLYDYFYVGYQISQISKEFDLLRISNDSIIDIELKHENTGDKVIEQLKQNSYYLKATKKQMYLYVYIANENKLFNFTNNELNECNFEQLVAMLKLQKDFERIEIDKIFNPTNYLISPFNNTTSFVRDEYFLTSQQLEFKTDIIKNISNNKESIFIGVTGKSGTGKSLLIYDIAKHYQDMEKVSMIHCGILNEGHCRLIELGYNILPAKNYEKSFESKIIIIDEVQRMFPHQLKQIIQHIEKKKKICIFSYDQEQTLEDIEISWNNEEMISNVLNYKYKLSGKIRTNPEMSAFIMNMFDLSKRNPNYSYSNISIYHYKTPTNAQKYIDFQKSKGYCFINFTGSLIYSNPEIIKELQPHQNYNAHHVIGQEFDKVLVVVDETFYYLKENLASRRWPNVKYNGVKMLYQAISRVRKKLCIIVINNQTVFNALINIKNK